MDNGVQGTMTTHNTHTGSGYQHNNNAQGTQNIHYGDQGVNFVKHFNTTTPNPHKTLWDAVFGIGASHTAEQQFERGQCLEGTREEVLRVILEWIASKKCSLPICWLSGTAGVGKSAIAMTVAKSCEGKGLVASFFFFRSDPKRNNPSALMVTISHGLVVNMPIGARTHINQRISDNPTILEARMEDQFRELVLKPSLRRIWWRRVLARLSSGFKNPDLIIIDGLDECGDESTQQRILSTILSSYQYSPRSPLRFLICSRPEAWIQEAFKTEDLNRITERIVLDDTFMPDNDIERYYLHEFRLICADPKHARVQFPTPWPSVDDLKRLVHKSSGQFVYAVTAVRFIKLAHPITQLGIILDYTPENSSSRSSFSKLDGLYHTILSLSRDHEQLLSVLAAVLILPAHAPPSPDFIELLFGLPAGEVDISLRPLHSVLNIRGGDEAITVYHTSFIDFLYDPSRSRELHIDPAAYHHTLALQWFKVVTRILKTTPKIVLNPDAAGLTPTVRQLLGGWVSFFFADKQSTADLRVELLRRIFSLFPERQSLLEALAAVALCPPNAPNLKQLLALNKHILRSGRVHIFLVTKLLETCRLVRSSNKIELEPFLLAFLCDPSSEYHIDLPKQHHNHARRWIRVLVPSNQPASKPNWGLRTLWTGWADFCGGIVQPSDGLLSDLQNLDLVTVVAVASSIALAYDEPPSTVAQPFETLVSWLRSVNPAVPHALISRFSKTAKPFLVNPKESLPNHRPAGSTDNKLDCLYHAVLSANPDHEQLELILAAITILPGHLEPTPAHIELLLGLPLEQATSTLRAMYSVLDIGEYRIRVSRPFRDYLVDWNRSRRFYVHIPTQTHALAGQWLRNLTTGRVRTYSSTQRYSVETVHFFTGWIGFCTSITPTRDLLDDLRNVDLASTYLAVQLSSERQAWNDVFFEVIPWVRRHVNIETGERGEAGKNIHLGANRRGHLPRIDEHDEVLRSRDSVHFVEGLVHKFQELPRRFHLDHPRGVFPRTELIYWIVRHTTSCYYIAGPNGSPPNAIDDICFTDCHCGLSGRGVSRDPGHIAYRDACLQLVKAFISRFGELAQSGKNNTIRDIREMGWIFLNMVESPLLQHCRLDEELLSLCWPFFKIVKGCSAMWINPSDEEHVRANMLEWIETFPIVLAKEGERMKAQVLALPWKQWAQTPTKRSQPGLG
ncbi:hypothetical protein PQX77_012433 [Marasmius sp. AFHP31]|nr:hypothetical protein PQX77_012433 [Marasmius sp. AFHP31]